MAAGTQGRIPRGGKRLLAPREGFPAAGNGRWHPGKDSPRRETAAGTQGRISRRGKRPLAPREGFPAAGNGRGE